MRNDTLENDPDCSLSDGIHLSKIGNHKLAEEIVNCVHKITPKRVKEDIND